MRDLSALFSLVWANWSRRENSESPAWLLCVWRMQGVQAYLFWCVKLPCPVLHIPLGTLCHGIWGTSAKHPKSKVCLSALSGYCGALKSVHLISTSSINTCSLTLKGSSQFEPVMDGLVAQAGGMMNSNQWTPLGLLSMGYFLKHLLPGYPSSDNHRSRHKEWSSQRWGLWQLADTFWGFHHHILSLHDQSDSRTCWCSLTRTVFNTCNKSMISSDDRRPRWWISVKVPQVDSPSRLMWSLWSRGAVPVKQASSIKVKCIVAPDKKKEKSNLKLKNFCDVIPFVQ